MELRSKKQLKPTASKKEQKMLSIEGKKEDKKTQNNKETSEKTTEESVQCGICLEPPTVRGVLDSCAHPFCFECINQWSKTSNTCPFCKQRFKQISKTDPRTKKLKKVRVKHADQRPTYDEPSWFEVDSEDDEEYDSRFYPLDPWSLIEEGFFWNDSDEEDNDNMLDFIDDGFELVDDFSWPIELSDIIDLTIDTSFQSSLPDDNRRNAPRQASNQRSTRRTTNTPRANVNNMRTRANTRSAVARRNTTQQQRNQTTETVGELARRYRVRR